jgi:hypothetical protein
MSPRSTAPRWYDLMSYCANTNESDSWISTRNWNRRLGGPADQPSSFRLGGSAAGDLPKPRSTTGPTLVVACAYYGNVPHNFRVVPGGSWVTPSRPNALYRVVVKDAAGKVVSDTGVNFEFLHVDHAALAIADFVAEVPAANAASVELVDSASGHVLEKMQRDATPPTVKLLSPAAGTHIKGLGHTVVRWTRTGNAPDATVEYSPDGGKTWRRVTRIENASSASIPNALLTTSSHGRIRVDVDDGFDRASAVSGLLRVDGAPPKVVIEGVEAAVEVPDDAPLSLSGRAVDQYGRPLTRSALRWFHGRTLLGRGTSVLAQGLGAGRQTIRLVATDSRGLRGAAQVVVRVRAVTPHLVGLMLPQSVRRSARTIVIKAASTVPGLLIANGRRFCIGLAQRSYVITIGRKARVAVSLTLIAGGKRATFQARLGRR